MTSCGFPRVSVVIPFYKNKEYLKECISHCLNLDYPDYEIIVVSGSPLELHDESVKLVTVDSESQGFKKDAGVASASGEICAFMDDDAYPARDWLRNAVKHFEDPQVGGVCGPGVTPPDDGVMQRAGGFIYSSPVGSGPLRFRYIPTKPRYIDEGPGYNMLVRRSLFTEIGGISAEFRSGDDTLLCRKIRRSGKRILYAPDVIVYHHRRPLFLPHLLQVRNYAFHRGFFAKKFRDFSSKPIWSLPAFTLMLLVIVSASLLTGLVQPILAHAILLIAGVYLLACFVSGLWLSRSVALGLLTMAGIPLSHLAYAIGFLQGLLTRRLGERPSY